MFAIVWLGSDSDTSLSKSILPVWWRVDIRSHKGIAGLLADSMLRMGCIRQIVGRRRDNTRKVELVGTGIGIAVDIEAGLVVALDDSAVALVV